MSGDDLAHREVVYRYARHHPSKFCEASSGKVKYPTNTAALNAAVGLQRLEGGVLSRAYRCPASTNPKRPHYHLTREEMRFRRWTGVVQQVLLNRKMITVHCGPGAAYPKEKAHAQ